MAVRAFGRPAIVGADGPVELRGDREAALLAVLAINSGSAVTKHQLLDELWRGFAPSQSALRVAVSRLRNRFTTETGRNPIHTTSNGYLLDLERADIDVCHFDWLARRAIDAHRGGRPHEVLDLAERALRTWTGEPYSGLDDMVCVQTHRAALTNVRADLVHTASISALRIGRPQLGRSILEGVVEQHRYREGTWALLAIALAHERRQADALRVLRRLRANLRDDLGISPSPDVQALESQLLTEVPPDLLGQPFVNAPIGSSTAESPPIARPGSSRSSLDPVAPRLRGREHELGELNEVGESCRRDRRLVSVEILGPAGIGKTAMIRSWLEQQEYCGWETRYGTAGPERAIPFEAVVGAFPEIRPSEGRLAAITRSQLLHQLLERVERLAADRPLILALDDAHYFDSATVAFIRHLTTRDADRAIVLAWTRRPGARPDHLTSCTQSIRMRELDPGTIAEIVRDAAPELSSAKVARIVETSDGVAGFAVELAHHKGEGTPATAAALAAERRARLDGLGRELVDLVAVAGRPLDLGQLGQLCERDRPTVAMAASSAVEARALVDDDGLRFSHDLYRAGTLDAIPQLRRQALHARIARHLRRTSEHPTRECAMHALAAGPTFGPGLRTLVSEAAVAAAMGVEPEAALELCEQVPDSPQLRLTDDARLALARGIAHASLGDGQLARDDLAQALELATEAGEARLIAHVVFAHKLFGLPVDDPIELMTDVVIPGPRRSDEDMLLLRAIWSTISFARGDCDLARELAELAGTTAERAATAAAATIEAHASIVTSFLCGGPTRERLQFARAGREAAEAAHDALFEHLHLGAAAAALMASGDLAGTRRSHEELIGLPATSALVLARNLIDARAATMLICHDRLDEAEAAIHEVWTAAIERGRPDATLTFAGQLFLLRWAQGRLPELLEQIGLLESVESDVPASFRAASAMCHAAIGDAEMARQYLDGLTLDLPAGRPDLVAITLAATTRWWLGDRIDHRWGSWLVPFSDEHAVADMSSAVTFGPVRRTMAVVAAANGDHERAATELERARDECISSGQLMFARLISSDLVRLTDPAQPQHVSSPAPEA